MKRTLKQLTILIAGITFLFVSCGKENKLKTKNIQRESVCMLSDDSKDTLSIKLDIEYPTGGPGSKGIELMTQDIIASALDSSITETDIEKACELYIEKTQETYKADFKTLIELRKETELNDVEMPPFRWERLITGSFAGKAGKVISYEIETYVYEGGAHGLSGKRCINYNLQNGEKVSESDFFEEGYQEELARLLTEHLSDALENEEAYQALFVKDIEPNGNFEISEDGITYVYGQYEIGPYYLGIIEITIPWEEISPVVKKEMLTE